MYTVWTQHLKTDEEKESYKREILGSRHVLRHLGTILRAVENNLEASERSPKVYSTPGWSFKQADTNGYMRCLKEIQALVDLDQEDINERPTIRPTTNDTRA